MGTFGTCMCVVLSLLFYLYTGLHDCNCKCRKHNDNHNENEFVHKQVLGYYILKYAYFSHCLREILKIPEVKSVCSKLKIFCSYTGVQDFSAQNGLYTKYITYVLYIS